MRTGKSSQMNLLNQKKADLQEQRQAAQLLYKRAYRDLQDRGKVFEEKKFKVSELKKQLFRLRKELNIEEGEEPNQRSTDLTKKEETILKFVSLIEKIDKKNAEITKLSKRWKELLSEQARFQKECHSTQDKEKLKKFLTLFFEKARLFGFTGLHLKKLKLSLDSYQPILDNFDLSSDLSGSDHVRLIWAYHIALLETATFFNCNHPGFLVLDEPAQQNVGKENLKVFIRHLSKLDPTVHQIIAATSGNASDLQETLGSETIHWIDLGENSFPPLSE
ncbi:MAG: hypothetical protein JXB25_02315 [Deltaproteobacteria bacterium]|nr:hypothetical protein [Deltaproteobacteria bacterium]